MNDHGWWWHLWNDPIGNNPWSLLGVILTCVVIGAAYWWLAGWRQRRCRKRPPNERSWR